MTRVKLFCFDVDGTLLTEEMKNEGEYVIGEVSTTALKAIVDDGRYVAICSPSPFAPKGYKVFADFGSNEYRWRNVFDAMKHYRITNTNEVLYIDDLYSNRAQLQRYSIDGHHPHRFTRRYQLGWWNK